MIAKTPRLTIFLLLAAMAIVAALQPAGAAIACSIDRDFICPDPACLGSGDPDCCNNVTSCAPGSYCHLASGTCLTRSGQICYAQDDCSGDTYCSVDANLCVSRRFVFARPDTLKVKVGSEPVMAVTLFDPANRTGAYTLSVSGGTGRYFAKFFGTRDDVQVFLKATEATTVPLHFFAGSIGNYQLKVQAVDSIYHSTALADGNPAGIAGWSDVVNIEVFSETNWPGLVSSPGPSGAQLSVLLGLAASILLFFLL